MGTLPVLLSGKRWFMDAAFQPTTIQPANTMKILRYAVMSMIAVMLSASGGMAQTILTNSYTNSFSAGGNTNDFSNSGSVHSWLYWYGVGYGNTPVTNDVTMDAGGDPTSGSLFLD